MYTFAVIQKILRLLRRFLKCEIISIILECYLVTAQMKIYILQNWCSKVQILMNLVEILGTKNFVLELQHLKYFEIDFENPRVAQKEPFLPKNYF